MIASATKTLHPIRVYSTTVIPIRRKGKLTEEVMLASLVYIISKSFATRLVIVPVSVEFRMYVVSFDILA